MERINKWAVMPKRGEVEENILDHEEVFSVPFGAAHSIQQFVGDRYRTDENPGVVCVGFETDDHTEIDVGYTCVLSGRAEAVYEGKLFLMISKKPWAIPGDPDNIVEAMIGDDRVCSTFVSEDGKDPRTNMFRRGYGPRPGGGYGMIDIPILSRPDGGLRPRTRYYFTLRLVRDTGNIMALNIKYIGTDDPEHGGEEFIDTMPVAIDPAIKSYELNLPIIGHGVFIPDQQS